MRDALYALITAPSAASYLELLRLVVAQPDFELRSDDMRTLWRLYEAGAVHAVKARIAEVMRLWLHSPEIHILDAAVARRLGDSEHEQFARLVADRCFQGMRASGDGSFDHPYQVARIDDEYALLNLLDKTFARQRMLTKDGRIVDAMECSDGSVLHFQLPAVDPP